LNLRRNKIRIFSSSVFSPDFFPGRVAHVDLTINPLSSATVKLLKSQLEHVLTGPY
jgi:hypothetical protein